MKLKSLLSLAFRGAMVGCVTAIAVFFFKVIAKYLEKIAHFGFDNLSILGVTSVFAGAAALMWVLHEKIPEAKGGGILKSKAVIFGKEKFRPIHSLIGTVLGSAISFLCSIPVGSEGPSVLIGTSFGNLFGKKSETMSAGAGAGFAVATGAPLSGVIFTLEEVCHSLTAPLLVSASSAVVFAHFINRVLSGIFNVPFTLFSFPSLSKIELKDTWYLLVLAVIITLAVAVFDFCNNHFKPNIPSFVKILAVFLLTCVLGYVFSHALFSGHDLIMLISENSFSLGFLLLIFIVRLVMMILVSDSGVTGGAFIPTLALGALMGAVSGKILILMGMNESLFLTVVVIGMCAFLGGIMRAPITASVLFLELTGSFSAFLAVILTVFLTAILTRLLSQEPFYKD